MQRIEKLPIIHLGAYEVCHSGRLRIYFNHLGILNVCLMQTHGRYRISPLPEKWSLRPGIKPASSGSAAQCLSH